MSNASLKEQLQSLSLGSPTKHTNEKDKKTNKPTHSDKQKHAEKNPVAAQKPAWLEYAQYGVELLKAHYPECFKDIKEIAPLKVGIKQDLVKLLSTRDDIVISDKACMTNSLAYYVNSAAYHKAVVEGATRIDLTGNSAGLVTPEEAQYSSECRKAKLQKKKSPQATHNTTSERIQE
jgi:sRNA-binding protein